MKRKLRKENLVILFTVILVYCIQLIITRVCLNLDDYSYFERYLYIPSIKFQLFFSPIISWTLMYFVNVSWIDVWEGITILFLLFFIPFESIVMIVGLWFPLLLFEVWTWISMIIFALVAGIIIFMCIDV